MFCGEAKSEVDSANAGTQSTDTPRVIEPPECGFTSDRERVG